MLADEIIPLLEKNSVTGLITNSCSTVNTIPELLTLKYQRIWYVFVNKIDMFISVKTINRDMLNTINIVNNKEDFEQDTKLNMSTIECMNTLLLDPSFNLLVDVVIVSGTSRYNLQSNIFIGLWNQMKTQLLSKPKLLLILDHNEIRIPSDLDIAIINDVIDSPKIIYKPTESADIIKSLIYCIKTKHQVDINSLLKTYLVYCPKQYVNTVRLILSSIDKIKAVAIRPNYSEVNIEKILFSSHNGKRNVIVTHDILHLPNIDTVFDTMIYDIRYKTEIGNHTNIKEHFGKNIADKRASIGKECYRMCSEEYFETLKTQVQPEYRQVDIGPTLLFLINKGINPSFFFKEIIEERNIDTSLAILTKNGMLVNNKVTELGQFHCSLSLSKYPAMMLYNWLGLDNRKEIFPGIIISCILQHLESFFYLYPGNQKNTRTININNNTDVITRHYKEHFARWHVKNIPVGMYLNMWDTFAKDVKTLKPTKKILENWCKTNWIYLDTFQELLSSIINCFDYLENKYRLNIKIGRFNTDALIKLVNPLITNIYKLEYHQAIDENDNTYTNHHNESLRLNKKTHQLQYISNHPYKIVTLSKKKETFDKKANVIDGGIMFYHPIL